MKTKSELKIKTIKDYIDEYKRLIRELEAEKTALATKGAPDSEINHISSQIVVKNSVCRKLETIHKYLLIFHRAELYKIVLKEAPEKKLAMYFAPNAPKHAKLQVLEKMALSLIKKHDRLFGQD